MTEIPLTASVREIKEVVRLWVARLAEEKYDEAFAMILPEVPPCSGSLDKETTEWTPDLLRAVINNYGLPTPTVGQEQIYKVVAVQKPFKTWFEKKLRVHRGKFEEFDQLFLGNVRVDLPLNFESGDGVSDLTAEFFLRQVSATEMALVLLDIHVH